MTRTQRDRAAHARGELVRKHGSREVSSAIEAQRRLTMLASRGTRTKEYRFGPSDPRYGYLTRTYD